MISLLLLIMVVWGLVHFGIIPLWLGIVVFCPILTVLGGVLFYLLLACINFFKGRK